MNNQTQHYNAPVFHPPTGEPKREMDGCLKFGAIGCGILLLIFIVGGYLTIRGIMKFASSVRDDYTFTEPMELPQVEFTEEESRDVIARVARFAESMDANDTIYKLHLTSHDLNILINHEQFSKELAGKVFVTIEDDQIRGQISFPLDTVSPFLKGRYINGSGEFQVGLAAGRLFLYLDSLVVGDTAVSEAFMEGIRKENLAEGLGQDPKISEVITKLDTITVHDGILTLISKVSDPQ